MSQQIVPLSVAPNQVMTVTLAIDGTFLTLQLSIKFNTMSGYWVMQIADRNGVVLIDSVPMITGEYPAANLLQQHQYMAIGSCYIINASQTPLDAPNQTNLGSDFLLLWDDTQP